MSKRSLHVVPNPNGGWSVKKSDASRATKTFDTQKDAVEYGRDLAKNSGGEFIIHGRDGMIKSSNPAGP
jgi:hypothetical protein